MKSMNNHNMIKTEYMNKAIKCKVISLFNHVLCCQGKKNTYNFCPFNNTF
jgi:hypothetical protein